MVKKGLNNKTSSKTTKNKIKGLSGKKRKRGFTLLELIIIILAAGIFLVFAIPFVIGYFNDSSKESYINIAKDVLNAAKKSINLGTYEMFDTDITYYIEGNCIVEKIDKSSYGEVKIAYVVVTYDGKEHSYYWTSVSDSGHGVKKIIRYDKLGIDSVEEKIKVEDITTTRGIDGRKKIVVVDRANGCNKNEETTALIQLSSETGEIISK